MSPTKGVSVSDHETSRRNLLGGLAAAGVALPVLAACGSSDGSGDSTGTTGGDPSTSGGATGGATGGSSGGGIKTSEIPVGGGKIFADDKIVVTQPAAGDFKAFSAVCTHQACLVAKVSDGTIDCPCHGSKFNLDGTVANGPADKPLPAENITVQGDEIVLG